MAYQKSFSGKCPKTGRMQPITLTVEQIQFAAHQPPSNKVLTFSCALEDSCNIADFCPVYCDAKRKAENS